MMIKPEVCENLGMNSANEPALELRKAIYGLKQVERWWSELLHKKLHSLNFSQCLTDTCVYWKRTKDNFVIVGVYVNALLVTATQENTNTEFLVYLIECLLRT